MKNILGNSPVFLDAHGPDDVNNDNAKRKTGNGVHGPVALNKTGKQRAALIGAVRLHGGKGRARIAQGGNDQDRKEDQEQRIDDLSDPNRDLSRPQGKEQHQGKEHQ